MVLQLEIKPEVIKKAQKLGLVGRTEDRIIDMVDKSAPFKMGEANRRYYQWIFGIRNNEVLFINKHDFSYPLEDKSIDTDFYSYKKKIPESGKVYPESQGCTICGGTRKVSQSDDCCRCNGKGCSGCGYTGRVWLKVSCPAAQNDAIKDCSLMRN